MILNTAANDVKDDFSNSRCPNQQGTLQIALSFQGWSRPFMELGTVQSLKNKVGSFGASAGEKNREGKTQ